MAAPERVPGETHARPELLEVSSLVGTEDVLDELAGIIHHRERRAGVQVAGVADHVVKLPAQTQVQRKVRSHLPIVLHVRAKIGVGVEGHDRWARGGGALDRNCDGNITIIRRAGVARAHAAGKIFGGEDAPAAKEIKERKGVPVLPFAPEPEGVVSAHPAQRVSNLVAVELCALRDAEVGAVLQAREADFISLREPGGIGHRVIRAESRNGIQEPVRVKDETVDHAR